MEERWSKTLEAMEKTPSLQEETAFGTKRDLLYYLFSRDYKRLKSFHQLNEYNLIEILCKAYYRYQRLGQIGGAGVSFLMWNTAARNWRLFSKLLMTGLCIHYGGQISLYYHIDVVFLPATRILKIRHNRKTLK